MIVDHASAGRRISQSLRLAHYRFGYCRKLTERAERFSRTLAEFLRGQAKFSFSRGDAEGEWFWLGSESQPHGLWPVQLGAAFPN
jgi:hypothetical protein